MIGNLAASICLQFSNLTSLRKAFSKLTFARYNQGFRVLDADPRVSGHFIKYTDPLFYKTHLDNTATADTARLQTDSIQHPPASLSPKERLLVMSTANEKFFIKKVKFTQVFHQITPIKVVIHEFYVTYGHYPESLDELGFNAKSFDTGELIRGIQLSKTGEIRIDLNSETFGKRKHLILSPKEIMGGMNIEWSCSSNLERNLVPFQCDSTA